MAAPALMNMSIPNLLANSPNPQAQGMAILQAALKQQQGNQVPGGAPGNPQPLSLAPPSQGGMGLLSKLFGGGQQPAPGGPVGPGIDPNTGMPPMGASAAMPNLGGAGPMPTAMTGLW